MKAGDQVYQVAHRHLLTGDVTYTMTSNPATDSFAIDQSKTTLNVALWNCNTCRAVSLIVF